MSLSSWVPGAGWVADKLLAVLSKFVDVSERSDLVRLGVLHGAVSLSDVRLKAEVVNAIGLPVVVVSATVREPITVLLRKR